MSHQNKQDKGLEVFDGIDLLSVCLTWVRLIVESVMGRVVAKVVMLAKVIAMVRLFVWSV